MFLGCVYSVRSLLTTLFGHPADRDGDINQLRSEVHEVLGNRNVSDEKFQAVVLDEIASLKVGTCSVVQHMQCGTAHLPSGSSKGHLCAVRISLLLMQHT